MKSLQYVLIRLYLRFLLFGDFTDAKSTVSAGVQHGVPGWGLGDLKQAPPSALPANQGSRNC